MNDFVGNYTIPEWNIGRLQEKIDELNARAEKLGCASIQFEVGNARMQAHDGKFIRVFDVVVSGFAPVIEGWRFVAKIDHDERGSVVRSFEDVPEEFFNRGPVCDHCGQNRQRKQTFVLVRDGEYKQVGSTCLKDFTGHADPMAVADFYATLEGMDEIIADFDDFENGSGRSEYVELDDYMACVVASYNDFGWIGRSAMGLPTADEAIGRYVKHEFSDAESAMAVKVIDWARAEFDIESTAQYEHNMAVIFSQDFIKYQDIGYAASAIIGYKKSLEVETNSEYVGDVKDRLDLENLTLVFTKSFDGYYGVSHLHKFVDESGNIFVWFTGSVLLDEGEVYSGKGTVKEHKEYNGEKQTVLTRCKLELAE